MPLGPPDLSTTAIRFATPVTRRRFPSATPTSEGLDAEGAPVDTPVLAHHWPAPGATIERLPEGTETSDVREGTVFAIPPGDALLIEANRATGTPGDSLVWEGREYQVVEVGRRVVNETGIITWSTFVAALVRP